MAKTTLLVKDTQIRLINLDEEEFICLTDMTQNYGGGEVLKNWLRNRQTIEFLGVWETANNTSFNIKEFTKLKNEAGSQKFILSVKDWIVKTNAVGIKAKSGRHGGTYAHKDIAFEFGSWLSPEFKYFLIKDYQRLKNEQEKKLLEGWNAKRFLSKVNYRLHTDSIKRNMGSDISIKQQRFVYASEADMLNTIVFGVTAKEWSELNKDKDGNIRDYADAIQLVVLANLETLNALFLDQKMSVPDRFQQLSTIAKQQFDALDQKLLIDKNSKKQNIL